MTVLAIEHAVICLNKESNVIKIFDADKTFSLYRNTDNLYEFFNSLDAFLFLKKVKQF